MEDETTKKYLVSSGCLRWSYRFLIRNAFIHTATENVTVQRDECYRFYFSESLLQTSPKPFSFYIEELPQKTCAGFRDYREENHVEDGITNALTHVDNRQLLFSPLKSEQINNQHERNIPPITYFYTNQDELFVSQMESFSFQVKSDMSREDEESYQTRNSASLYVVSEMFHQKDSNFIYV
ncbi:hypothetical protein CBL_07143 [Carabus blaptoides fortunei]